MADNNDFTGISLEITWNPQQVDKKIKEIQDYLSNKKIDISINFSQDAIKNIEQFAKQSQQKAKETKEQWSNVLTDLSKLSNVKTTIIDGEEVKKVATIHNELGELETITQKLNVETGKWAESTKVVSKYSEDAVTRLTQQLDLAQKGFANKSLNLTSNFAGHFDQNELDKLNQQASGLQINEQLSYQISSLTKKYEELGIVAKASMNAAMHSTVDLEHELAVFNLKYESMLIKFSQSKQGLFNPFDIETFRSQKDEFLKSASSMPIEDVRKKMQMMNAEFGKFNADTIAKGLNNANKSAMSFSESISTAAYKMGIWLGTGNLFFGFISQLQNSLKYIEDTNRHLITMQMEMTDTKLNFSEITNQSNAFAYSMGSTTDKVVEALDVFANYNTSLSNTIEKSKSAILLGNLTGDSIKNSSDALLSIAEQYNMAADQYQHITDVLAGGARMLMMDYPEAIKQTYMGIERVGSVASVSGVSLERLTAMIGTTAEKTRMSGDVIGWKFKRVA